MKKRVLQIIIMLTVVLVTVSAHAGDFKNVVVFGDSLSDNGNSFVLHEGYPSAPYYDGRFSDGPVWVEYLVEALGIKGLFFNYAHGGARTDETNNQEELTGFLTQVQKYVNLLEASQNFPTAFSMPEDTLFIIWIGGNDFLGDITDPVAAITQAVGNIQTGMMELMQAGAAKFLVVNLPDLGKAPRFNKNVTISTQASQLAAGFNQGLEQLLAGFESANPDLEINRLDTYTFIDEIVENYELSGFTNAVDTQLDTEQGSIGEGIYIFWDEVHPTTKTHKLIAQYAADTITCDTCRVNRAPYFEDGLTLTVPYVELEDNGYGFKLVPYYNSYEEGIYWMLDITTLTVE